MSLTLAWPPPPTHSYAGSNSERQCVGKPGHCEACAQFGHVRAHPDLGCGDVGCNRHHDDDREAAAQREAAQAATPTTSPTRAWPPPTHPYSGSNSARQSVGKPGHCEACAEHGHVKAHPDLGCGDVGCNRHHEE